MRSNHLSYLAIITLMNPGPSRLMVGTLRKTFIFRLFTKGGLFEAANIYSLKLNNNRNFLLLFYFFYIAKQ